MTNLTELSNKELSEAIDFHRRQRNMSRGVNESAHMRQTQVVRLLEAEEARRLNEAVNEKQIKKDLDSGMPHDVVIGKHANKNTTNTDEIRKVIKQHAWDNRMKKEEVELDESIGGLFKDSSEWERSAKDRGLVVKPATHPSGEMTKYQIAKDKQGNNRGHFDHGTKSGRLTEEVELNENSPQHVPGKKWDETKEKWVTVKRSAYDPKKERGHPSTPDQGQKRSDFDEANIHRDFSDNPTPLPNKLTYALDKSNTERKPVSLKKAPWDVKKESANLSEAGEPKVCATESAELKTEAKDGDGANIVRDREFKEPKFKFKSHPYGSPEWHANKAAHEKFKAKEAAKKSMKKEEVEQIDELSKDTLVSYMKKSMVDRSNTAKTMSDDDYNKMHDARKVGSTYKSPDVDRFNKRTAGGDLAFKKFDQKRRMSEEVKLDEGHYHVSWSPNLSHTVMNAKSADHAVAAAKAHLIKKIPKLADEKYGDTFEKKPRVTNITNESMMSFNGFRSKDSK